MTVLPFCEGCRKPASRSRWEFNRDPQGRLCASCVAAGVTVDKARSPKRRPYGEPDPEVMALLRAAHDAKLRGLVSPLTQPGELSVYTPNGRSCLRVVRNEQRRALYALHKRRRRRRTANGHRRSTV